MNRKIVEIFDMLPACDRNVTATKSSNKSTEDVLITESEPLRRIKLDISAAVTLPISLFRNFRRLSDNILRTTVESSGSSSLAKRFVILYIELSTQNVRRDYMQVRVVQYVEDFGCIFWKFFAKTVNKGR